MGNACMASLPDVWISFLSWKDGCILTPVTLVIQGSSLVAVSPPLGCPQVCSGMLCWGGVKAPPLWIRSRGAPCLSVVYLSQRCSSLDRCYTLPADWTKYKILATDFVGSSGETSLVEIQNSTNPTRGNLAKPRKILYTCTLCQRNLLLASIPKCTRKNMKRLLHRPIHYGTVWKSTRQSLSKCPSLGNDRMNSSTRTRRVVLML